MGTPSLTADRLVFPPAPQVRKLNFLTFMGHRERILLTFENPETTWRSQLSLISLIVDISGLVVSTDDVLLLASSGMV